MGGILSTRWTGYARRRTVEEAANALRVGDARIALTGALVLRRGDAYVRLVRGPTQRTHIHRLAPDRWQLVIYRSLELTDAVEIERRPCRHSVIWLLRCPSCRSPRRALFVARPGDPLECRSCARLGYTSHRLARWDRANYLAHRAAGQLGLRVDGDGVVGIARRRRGLRGRTFASWRTALQVQLEARNRAFDRRWSRWLPE